MKERQELMKELLDNAHIPALSFSWCQNGTCHAEAFGRTNTLAPSPVDTNTLFQAASLSKPVSAAIVLDLINQNILALDTCLADIAEYGPPELRQDPYDEDYRKLTIAMVIGQCSGLANYGQDGDDGKKFIAHPGTRFTYSGVGLDFLIEVIEKRTEKKWEEVAQDFFKRVGINSSTFMRQLPEGKLHDTPREVASAHLSELLTDSPLTPLPPLPNDMPGIAAGSLITTAEDYTTFLQYCFKNEYLKSTLLKGVLSNLPPTTSPETSQVQWGLGMGVYSDTEHEKTIAFHWGNNTGSISFCAMDMATGDCVVSFANSMNGPNVFQQVAEPIVGELKSLFEWLSTYCGFKDVNAPKAPEDIALTVYAIHSLARKEVIDKSEEVTTRFKLSVQQERANYVNPDSSSTATEGERSNPSLP
jgi:CubicO group peptidase (beta-lactamase class C family)